MKKIINKIMLIAAMLIVAMSLNAAPVLEITKTNSTDINDFRQANEYTIDANTSMEYFYLNVTENGEWLENGYKLSFSNLESSNYYEYRVDIISESGKLYEQSIDILATDGGSTKQHVFEIIFIPTRLETGICTVKLYKKSLDDIEYPNEENADEIGNIFTFNTIRLVPQHVIYDVGAVLDNNGLQLEGEYIYENTDYTIYYTDDFFNSNINVNSSDFCELVEEEYVKMWNKMVVDWELTQGVTYNSQGNITINDRPKDYDRNIDIIIYDGTLPYHNLNTDTTTFENIPFTFINEDEKHIYIPSDLYEDNGYGRVYKTLSDAVATSMAKSLFNIIQQSLNEEALSNNNAVTPVGWKWLYNGAALAMQSIAVPGAEFEYTDTYYAEAVNKFLANPDTTAFLDNNRYTRDKDMMHYALYWRFLYENAIPNGTEKEKVQIFRIIMKYLEEEVSPDYLSYMNKAFYDEDIKNICKYKSFNHSWTAFIEKMLFLAKGSEHWERWYDNANNIYSTPKQYSAVSYQPNHDFLGYVKSAIENPYGTKIHRFDNIEFFQTLATQNLDFEFVGDGNCDWAVIINIENTENYFGGKRAPETLTDKNGNELQAVYGNSAISYILPIKPHLNKKKATFNLKEVFCDQTDAFFDVEELLIAVVRLDDNTYPANYSIGWTESETEAIHVIGPVHEYPRIINDVLDRELEIQFTIFDDDGDFVADNQYDNFEIELSCGNYFRTCEFEVLDFELQTSSYLGSIELPEDLPAGLYSIRIKRKESKFVTELSGYSPNSLIITVDSDCSGETLEENIVYHTGKAPDIHFYSSNNIDPQLILDGVYPYGTSVPLSFQITDDGIVEKAYLFFRRIEEVQYNNKEFFYIEMTGTTPVVNNVYSADIPDSIAVYPGCEFYVVAIDNEGRISTFPEYTPKEYPFKLAINKNSGDLSQKPTVSLLTERIEGGETIDITPRLTLEFYNSPIEFVVQSDDENSYVEQVGMYYRIEGEQIWSTLNKEITPVASTNVTSFSIPAGFSGLRPIEYVLYAVDNNGLVGYYGSKNFPKYLDFEVPAPELIAPGEGDTISSYTTPYLWEDLKTTYRELVYFYSYKVEIANDPDFSDIVGEQIVFGAPYYEFTNEDYDQMYYWRVKAFIDSYESGYSEVDSFYLATPAPEIQDLAGATSICEDELLYLEVLCNGIESDWTYQWFKNNDTIVNATDYFLIVSSATIDNDGAYHCIVSNRYGTISDTSIVVNVFVYTDPIIVNAPETQRKKLGSQAIFNIEIDGLGLTPVFIPVVEWFRGGDKLETLENKYTAFYEETDYDEVDPDTGDLLYPFGRYVLVINDISLEDYSDQYYVKIKDRCDTDSIPYTLSDKFAIIQEKTLPPVITVYPSAIEDCKEEAVLLTIQVAGGGSGDEPEYSYQWFRDGILIQDDANYSGTKTTELTINALKPAYEGNYYVEIFVLPYDTTLISTQAAVSIIQNPEIIDQSEYVVDGEYDKVLYLYCSATGDDLKFQWYFNQTQIDGATDNELIIQKYDTANAGYYYCEVWNKCDRVSSNMIEVVKVDDENSLQTTLSVSPNPISDIANIRYIIPQSCNMSISLINELGQVVSTLESTYKVKGHYNLAIDANRLNLSAGKYFILLQHGTSSVSVPVVIVN